MTKGLQPGTSSQPAGLTLRSFQLKAVALLGRGGTLKKCVNSQAVYPLCEQNGLEAQERRYTAHEEGKH